MASLKKYWPVPSMQTFLWLAPTLRRNKFSPPFFKILGEQIWKPETRGCWKTTGSDIVYWKMWDVLPSLLEDVFHKDQWPIMICYNNQGIKISIVSSAVINVYYNSCWKASTTDDRTDWVITKFIFWHDYQIALAELSKFVWHICHSLCCHWTLGLCLLSFLL